MTEVTCSSLAWDNDVVSSSAAVGELMPNYRARLVKPDTGAEVTTANEPAELWVSGPTLMQGYWNKPEATQNTLAVDADGTRWLKTGDIAYIEAYRPGGLWHVVDRLKELIKVKGNQVAPAELEAVLLENRGVADAAVVGVTIDGEEVPRAYVVPDPIVKQSERDVAAWMEGKVVRYKHLRGGVKFVESIPKNPVSPCCFSFSVAFREKKVADQERLVSSIQSGKILRRQLRDQATKEVGDRKPKASKLA